MIREVGEILEVKQNKIKVHLERKKSCTCCRYSNICSGHNDFFLENRSGIGLEKGDKIEVGVEEKKTFILSLMIFFAPALILIVTLFVFREKPEFLSFFFAI